ncbi:MAG: hypothetical protein FWC36_07485 [Spirochaetes bacterium]|nr:hypothetical protein [Spirochaetota bacterium]
MYWQTQDKKTLKRIKEPLIYSIENKLRSIPNLFGATTPYYPFFAVFCKKTRKNMEALPQRDIN